MCPPALVGGSGRYLAGEGGEPGRCSEECGLVTSDAFGEFDLPDCSTLMPQADGFSGTLDFLDFSAFVTLTCQKYFVISIIFFAEGQFTIYSPIFWTVVEISPVNRSCKVFLEHKLDPVVVVAEEGELLGHVLHLPLVAEVAADGMVESLKIVRAGGGHGEALPQALLPLYAQAAEFCLDLEHEFSLLGLAGRWPAPNPTWGAASK